MRRGVHLAGRCSCISSVHIFSAPLIGHPLLGVGPFDVCASVFWLCMTILLLLFSYVNSNILGAAYRRQLHLYMGSLVLLQRITNTGVRTTVRQQRHWERTWQFTPLNTRVQGCTTNHPRQLVCRYFICATQRDLRRKTSTTLESSQQAAAVIGHLATAKVQICDVKGVYGGATKPPWSHLKVTFVTPPDAWVH